MDDIEITYRNRILLLCLLILAIVGIFASVLAIIAFHSGIAVVFLVLCFLLGLIISGIYQSQEFQYIVIKERGGYKITDWKENWRWFFVVLTVGVLCFFVLFSPIIMPMLGHDLIGLLLMWTVGWIFIQGHWAYKKYRSGKFKKAVKLLCQAKHKNDGTFYPCLEKQVWRCRRIIGYSNSAQSWGSSRTRLIYESLEETEGRLKSYVEANYDGWREKFAWQGLKTDKEKVDEEQIRIPSRKEEKKSDIRKTRKNFGKHEEE